MDEFNIFDEGNYEPSDTMQECVYCGIEVPYGDVPQLWDDDAWEAEAGHHDADCEYVATRAFRI